MNSSVIVKMMTNLINKKFYDGKDEAIEKLDVYFAMNRISEEEYMELVCILIRYRNPPQSRHQISPRRQIQRRRLSRRQRIQIQ